LETWKKSRRTKKNLYHFAIFAIVNELLIIRNRRISLLLNASARRDPSCNRDS